MKYPKKKLNEIWRKTKKLGTIDECEEFYMDKMNELEEFYIDIITELLGGNPDSEDWDEIAECFIGGVEDDETVLDWMKARLKEVYDIKGPITNMTLSY